jgi:hypothetical protein
VSGWPTSTAPAPSRLACAKSGTFSPTSAHSVRGLTTSITRAFLFRGADGGPVGTSRRVQVKRDTLIERITEFDPPHALAYDIEGLPRHLRRVSNRWTLAATAGGSAVVTLTSAVEIGPGPTQKLAKRALCRFLARQSDVMLAGSRWTDPDLHDLRQHLRMQLKHARANSAPERNQPWPYASRGHRAHRRPGWRF